MTPFTTALSEQEPDFKDSLAEKPYTGIGHLQKTGHLFGELWVRIREPKQDLYTIVCKVCGEKE